MTETQPSTNPDNYSVKIAIAGVPKAVMNAIYVLGGLGFAEVDDWLEVKYIEDPEELTMFITLNFLTI